MTDLPYLRILQLDNNRIQCISAAAVRGLPQLVSLTLHTNNLTSLPARLVAALPRLQSLRLEHNKLECDCRLGWVLQHDTLAPLARCTGPAQLAGRRVIELSRGDLVCEAGHQTREQDCENVIATGPPLCPARCKCSEGIVDCRNRGLTAIPAQLPADTTEIRLEQNSIQDIPARAFSSHPRLRRM